MSDIKLSDDVKKFLDEDCKVGDFAALTLMVNKQHMKEFMEHLQIFQARAGVFQNGTDNAAVLGQNKKSKISLVDDDDILQ